MCTPASPFRNANIFHDVDLDYHANVNFNTDFNTDCAPLRFRPQPHSPPHFHSHFHSRTTIEPLSPLPNPAPQRPSALDK